MRQIVKSLPPVFEMLVFLLFFMLLFSMLGLSIYVFVFSISSYFRVHIRGVRKTKS